MEGIIFDIQRYSVNDGEGIRTVVFLKGCPLRCKWCANPESQKTDFSRIFWKNKCISCGKCIEACPKNIGNNLARQKECARLKLCVKACPTGALKPVGRNYTVDEVVRIVEKDIMFYTTSKGGVTVSGGEPLVQWEFVTKLLKGLQDNCIETAMETSGFAPFEHLWSVAAHCDQVLYDIKHMNSRIHENYTGVGNELILDNLARIREREVPVVIRIPLIHHVNDNWDNIEKTAEYAKEVGVDEIHLLPFHQYGDPKYEAIGRTVAMTNGTVPEENIKRIEEELTKKNLRVLVGG